MGALECSKFFAGPPSSDHALGSRQLLTTARTAHDDA